jgi:hypothetical protein
VFTQPDAWTGSGYDLLMNFGPPDDGRLQRVIETVWTWPDLDGCYRELNREPADQVRVAPIAPMSDDDPTSLRGIARIAGRDPIPCATYVVREPEIDWVYFGLPMGSLARVFPVGAFPFDDGSDLTWRETVDAWLCAIARSVWAKVEFRYAFVGGMCDVMATTEGRAEILWPEEVPIERWVGYLVPSGDGLVWLPPNRGAPIHRDEDP